MKIKVGIILLLAILMSCNSRKETKQEKADAEIMQILKKFVTESDTAKTFNYDASVFHLDTLLYECKANSNINTALVYILNSECSVCYARLFNFLLSLQKITTTIPVIVVSEAGNKETFKYYMEQLKSNIDNIQCIENIDNKYVEGKLSSHNGTVLYIYNGKVINRLLFEELSNANRFD